LPERYGRKDQPDQRQPLHRKSSSYVNIRGEARTALTPVNREPGRRVV